METNRWKVKELHAFDLIPDRDLINVFITTPKLTDIHSDYQEFKSFRSKSPKRIKYKSQPPLNTDKKVIKYEGPRLNQDLPKPIKLQVLRSNNKTQMNVQMNPQAELFIEDLIRNRMEIVLPKFDKPKSPARNLKEKFIKTRSEVLDERSSKCDSLLQDMKSRLRELGDDNEFGYWMSQPIRKWDRRNDRVVVQNKFQGTCRNREERASAKDERTFRTESLDEERERNRGNIGNLLEACGEEILNWPM